MAVTIKDVAKAAGVSHATVSRALRGNPAISAATSKHIREVANELGYVPNRAAQGLKTAKSNAIGILIRRFSDPFNADILDGIEDHLQANRFSLFLAASGHDKKKDAEIIASMAERRIDGLILCSKHIDDEQRATLRSFGIPTVHISEQAAGKVENSIRHDDAYGAEALTHHLIEQGHRRIAFIGNSNAGQTNTQRQLGYQSALTRAGIVLQPEYVVLNDSGSAPGGSAAAEKLMALEKLPSAIVCFNDMMAVGAIHAVSDAGLSVPYDISITGFDDVELAAYVTPTLTTFRQPRYEMGLKSAEMILQLISNQVLQTTADIKLRGELLTRSSTAAPSSQ